MRVFTHNMNANCKAVCVHEEVANAYSECPLYLKARIIDLTQIVSI